MVGSVADFLLDEEGWVIRYLVVDTGHWLSGRKVLVAPPWVSEVSWATQEVQVTLTRAQIEASPEYNPDLGSTAIYEEQLHGHYAGLATGGGASAVGEAQPAASRKMRMQLPPVIFPASPR